jgi:hypothetical protein
MFEVRQKGAALTFIVLSSANTALSANKLAHRRSERVTYPELYTWVGDEGGRYPKPRPRLERGDKLFPLAHLDPVRSQSTLFHSPILRPEQSPSLAW